MSHHASNPREDASAAPGSITAPGETAPADSVHDELLGFWGDPALIASIDTRLSPSEKPLAVLERLGPSPFERGGFPLIGFLATAYEKVSRLAAERTSGQRSE